MSVQIGMRTWAVMSAATCSFPNVSAQQHEATGSESNSVCSVSRGFRKPFTGVVKASGDDDVNAI